MILFNQSMIVYNCGKLDIHGSLTHQQAMRSPELLTSNDPLPGLSMSRWSSHKRRDESL